MVKIAILSSLAKNTGCYLRAKYLAESLEDYAKVDYIEPLPKSLPFMFDMILSIPINIIRVLFSDADIFIGIKPFPNLTIPFIIKKVIDKKYIIIDIDDLDSGYRKGLISDISSFMQKPFPKHFDMVTYHNDLLKNYIKKEFGVKEKRLYKLDQGVDLSVFDHRIQDKELRKKFPKNKKIVLYTGHLNIASDLEDMMIAMKKVQKKADCVFIVAGGGPDESHFKKKAKEMGLNIFFTGHIEIKDVARYISISDICLVYYKDINANYYRCSMKLRECMAMGKKVVTDDVGELKRFKKESFQTSPDNDEYAEMIVKVLKIDNDSVEKNALKKIQKEFDWKNIGRNFFNRLRNVV